MKIKVWREGRVLLIKIGDVTAKRTYASEKNAQKGAKIAGRSEKAAMDYFHAMRGSKRSKRSGEK